MHPLVHKVLTGLPAAEAGLVTSSTAAAPTTSSATGCGVCGLQRLVSPVRMNGGGTSLASERHEGSEVGLQSALLTS